MAPTESTVRRPSEALEIVLVVLPRDDYPDDVLETARGLCDILDEHQYGCRVTPKVAAATALYTAALLEVDGVSKDGISQLWLADELRLSTNAISRHYHRFVEIWQEESGLE